MNSNLRRLLDTNTGIYLIVLCIFAGITAVLGEVLPEESDMGTVMLLLAVAEALAAVFLLVFFIITRRKKQKELEKYIETLTYSTENAKDNTLLKFPLPIAVFRVQDTRIIWGNDMFFSISGAAGNKMDAKVSDLAEGFTSKWILDGKSQYPGLITLGDRKYRVHGNVIHPEGDSSGAAIMCITYWIDVTDYDNTRIEYEESRPVACVLVIDNYDELIKNLPERTKNDIRDTIEDRLRDWGSRFGASFRRYERDRYITVFEKRSLDKMKEEKFPILATMHSLESPTGIAASISMGLGADASSFSEALQFADLAAELALTRGGDQAVIKNRLSYEFFGGRGSEVEKRTKVKSRVMANTLLELIKDSSKVYVMGHRFSDLDCIGAAAGICCLARKCGIRYNIIVDEPGEATQPLIDLLGEAGEYRNVFISTKDAVLRADGRTLLVVADTNRPEQVENTDVLDACNRIAVIDHHRVSSTYIHNAVLGFIEPYASSACELVTEVLQETTDKGDLLKAEAEALLAGIVLDTKSFTLRTGERTFDAASYLRRCGADTTSVKKMMQSDIQDTISKYRILQGAKLYRGVAVAAPEEPQTRVVAAKAADELLSISGVDASIVVAPGEKGGVFASARSIGDVNVQIIMEKLGGGGNRSAAATQFSADTDLTQAVEMIYKAIDDYLG